MKKAIAFLLSLLIVMTAGVSLAEAGTYTGSAQGYGEGGVSVSVTVDDAGKITALEVTADTETPTVGGKAVQPMIDAILASGSADVDTVAGATLTSGAIIEATKAALASASGEAASSDQASMTPGTYTGTSTGHGGEIAVEVTVTENHIDEVKVVSQTETAGVSDLPLERIPADIVAYQSLGVDTVAGATMTSNGILRAAAAALTQAGADTAALRAVPAERPVAEVADMTAQVVVAGGGMSGLMAAATAAEQGAQVVLVEKLPRLGGSLLLAAGGLMTADSQFMIEQGANITVDQTMEFVHAVNDDAAHQPDYDFIRYMVEQSGPAIDYMIDKLGVSAFAIPNSEGLNVGRVLMSASGGGAGLVDELTAYLTEKGVTVVTDTAVTGIVMEDGKAVGVTATAPGGDFTITADKVIIATGGANYDRELFYAANPGLYNMTLDDQTSIGNSGDGIKMLEAIGAAAGEGPYIKSSMACLSQALGYTWSDMPSLIGNLVFDANGVRFTSEFGKFDNYGITSTLNLAMVKHGSTGYWALFDAATMDETLKAKLSAYDDKNVAVYGETIDEIASKLGIDAEVLNATFNLYQSACEKGVDTYFGKDPAYLIPYGGTEGYYAAYVQPGAWGTIGGVLTDRQFHAVDADGNPIGNVFAVGECATSTLFGDYYMGAFSLGYYATAGRIAGETAVAEINAAE